MNKAPLSIKAASLGFLCLLLIGCDTNRAKIAEAAAEVASAKAEVAKVKAEAEAATKAEVARVTAEAEAEVEKAKAETMKVKAEAKAEVAKAKAEAEAVRTEATIEKVEHDKDAEISQIVTFLNSADLSVKFETKTTFDSVHLTLTNSNEESYSNFAYDKKDQCLEFSHEYYSTMRGGNGRNFAQRSLARSKLDLRSSIPIVTIESHPKAQPELKIVGLKCRLQQCYVVKKEEKKGFVFFNDEEKIQFASMPYENLDQRDVSFTVSPEIAPRIKSALENLLKIHGVKVSKY